MYGYGALSRARFARVGAPLLDYCIKFDKHLLKRVLRKLLFELILEKLKKMTIFKSL